MSAQFVPRPGEERPAMRIAGADVPTAKAVGSPAVAGPTTEHLKQMDAARRALVPVRRGATWAALDGWTLLIFGGITVLCSFGINLALALGIAMCWIGWRDIQGGKALMRLDETAVGRLIQSQIILGLCLAAYAGLMLYRTMTSQELLGSGESAALMQAGPMGGQIISMTRSIFVAVYVGLLGFAVLGPGASILFYYRRGERMREYVAKTPAWIVELQRKGVPV